MVLLRVQGWRRGRFSISRWAVARYPQVSLDQHFLKAWDGLHTSSWFDRRGVGVGLAREQCWTSRTWIWIRASSVFHYSSGYHLWIVWTRSTSLLPTRPKPRTNKYQQYWKRVIATHISRQYFLTPTAYLTEGNPVKYGYTKRVFELSKLNVSEFIKNSKRVQRDSILYYLKNFHEISIFVTKVESIFLWLYSDFLNKRKNISFRWFLWCGNYVGHWCHPSPKKSGYQASFTHILHWCHSFFPRGLIYL